MEEAAEVMGFHPLADDDSGEMPILSWAAKSLMWKGSLAGSSMNEVSCRYPVEEGGSLGMRGWI